MSVYLELFWEYFKIGLFTIGGGYAMLPMVMQVVSKRGWLTDEQLYNFIGVAESTPGPFAINLATFVGTTVGSQTSLGFFGGVLGAIVATFAVVLPSIIIIIIVSRLMDKFQKSQTVQGVLYGIRPVVVGLILSAMLGILCNLILPNLDFGNLTESKLQPFNWVSLLLIVALFPLSKCKIKGKKIHPILLIVLSAGLGVLLFGVLKLQG